MYVSYTSKNKLTFWSEYFQFFRAISPDCIYKQCHLEIDEKDDLRVSLPPWNHDYELEFCYAQTAKKPRTECIRSVIRELCTILFKKTSSEHKCNMPCSIFMSIETCHLLFNANLRKFQIKRNETCVILFKAKWLAI